jgi:IclR family acetate operon transcriptional repressor
MPGDDLHEPSESRSGTQAVERAIAILETFSNERPSLGITEISRAVGLHVSTTHRLVRDLVAAEYVQQDPLSERYRLGIGIAILGQRALEQTGYHLAKPVLDELAAATGESASLGIRRGAGVVVIERAASQQPLRFDHPTGAEIPLHASGMGKALLAFSATAPQQTVAALPALTQFTHRTVVEPASLIAELEQSRQRGYAINREERYVGVNGIAAPVLGTDGIAHAAVGVQGPSLRLTPARLRELAPLVRAAADEVAARVRQR